MMWYGMVLRGGFALVLISCAGASPEPSPTEASVTFASPSPSSGMETTTMVPAGHTPTTLLVSPSPLEASPSPFTGPTGTPTQTSTPTEESTPTQASTPTPQSTDADGDGFTVAQGDCNDASADHYPGAPETDCSDPEDYNCDGQRLYADEDGDGEAACEDCDDLDAERAHHLSEICDEKDNDCNDLIDEADPELEGQTYYIDADGDGYGQDDATVIACEAPPGTSTKGGDCDDQASGVHPETIWHRDRDGDGNGNDFETQMACEKPEGYVGPGGDCNDEDVTYHPGAEVQCDGEDHNCDGLVDSDGDGDGYSAASCGGDDCDDENSEIYPAYDSPCAHGKSCLDILSRGKAQGDGPYTIDIDGYDGPISPSNTHCDMTTEGGGWVLLFNLSPMDAPIHDYDDESFWLSSEIEGQVESALNTSYKSINYSVMDDFSSILLILHDGAEHWGYARYEKSEGIQGSFEQVLVNYSNQPISGDKSAEFLWDAWPADLEDVFLHHTGPLIANYQGAEDGFLGQSRLSTALELEADQAFAGLGGYFEADDFALAFESAPVSIFCPVQNVYGAVESLGVGNFRAIDGYQSPLGKDCTLELSYHPLMTAVFIR